MKTSSDEIFLSRKEIKLTCQVMITLDETIGSKLLHHKFKYQTSELQLFLQNVPVLSWYPLKVIGTTIYDTLDSCIFSAVIRNNFYNPSNKDLLNTVVVDMLRFYNDDDEKKQKLGKLLKSLLNDELYILQALEKFKKGGNNENPLEYISDQLKDDEKFMLKAIKINNDSIKYASDRLRTILLKGIENDQLSSHFDKDKSDEESDNIQHDGIDQLSDDEKEKIILESIKSKSKLEANIFEMLKENNYHLFRSFNRLNDNEQIVLELIKYDTRGFQYASNRLKDDSEFLLKLVKDNYSTLEYASNRLKDDEQFILQAVKLNGFVLKYASDRFKDNEQIVLESVKQNGYTLQFVSNRFKDNELIVLEAVKKNGDALQYASNRFKDNEQIVLEAVKQHRFALAFVSNRLQDNEQIVLEAVKQYYDAFRFASNRLQDNEEFVLQVVKQDGYALHYAYDRLKDDENIVLEAINQNGKALYYASNRLKNDFNFAKEIFKYSNTLGVFGHFGDELRNIEFINYYIENYQSNFHELIRKNTHRRESNVYYNAYNDFMKIITIDKP